MNWNDLQRSFMKAGVASPVQKLLLRCSLWRVKKKLGMDMYNRACWVRAYCYYRQKLVSTGILYISDIFTFIQIFSNIFYFSNILQHPPISSSSSSILQDYSTVSNIIQYEILQHSPISSVINHYSPTFFNILKYPPLSTIILQHSSTFSNILRYQPLSSNIIQHSPISSVINHYPPTFFLTFCNILLYPVISSNILQHSAISSYIL